MSRRSHLPPTARRIATGSADTTILVWDANKLKRESPAAAELSEERLKSLWADLADGNAAKAGLSIRDSRRRRQGIDPIPGWPAQAGGGDRCENHRSMDHRSRQRQFPETQQGGPGTRKDRRAGPPRPQEDPRIRALPRNAPPGRAAPGKTGHRLPHRGTAATGASHRNAGALGKCRIPAIARKLDQGSARRIADPRSRGRTGANEEVG